MNKPHLFPNTNDADRPPPTPAEADPIDDLAEGAEPVAPAEARPATTRLKFAEGSRGIKLAIRAESSFFAHGYRGLLIAITAAILGVTPAGWCFLIVSAALVLVAETFRCAITLTLDLLAEPGDPRAKAIREIASGGLLFASITAGALTIMVLSARLSEMLGW